jgi:hypothetical protein
MVAGEVKFIAPFQLWSWTVASEHFAHWGRSAALSRIRFRARERTYWRTQSHHRRLGPRQSCRYQNLALALIYQIKFAFVPRHAWPHFFKPFQLLAELSAPMKYLGSTSQLTRKTFCSPDMNHQHFHHFNERSCRRKHISQSPHNNSNAVFLCE